MSKTIIKECLYCKKQFKALLSEHKRGYGKFCSRSCSGSYGNKIRKRKITLNCSCAYCGKKFHKAKNKLKNSKSGLFFCCREHKDLAQRIGGIKEIMPPHYGKGISTYRKKAFKHYPIKCNKCGYNTYPEILQVHHIDRNLNNVNISNLEILCPTCHMEDHFIQNDGLWTN